MFRTKLDCPSIVNYSPANCRSGCDNRIQNYSQIEAKGNQLVGVQIATTMELTSAKKLTYWQRKAVAFRNFGKAEERPQQNFRAYLLEKRRLNLGYRNLDPQQEQRVIIDSFNVTEESLSSTSDLPGPYLLPYDQNQYRFVNNEQDFKKMIERLEKHADFSIDLENNNDHSFHGMACLIQIGVGKGTYLVDPFPLFSNIQAELKKLLESTQWIKVVHGCANDVFTFQRDFSISLAGVIDIQLVHQEMMKAVHQLVGKGSVSEIFDDNGVIERATGLKKDLLPSDDAMQRLLKASSDLIKLENLVRIYFPQLRIPVDATLADWRIRPLTNQQMIDYAVFDAHMAYYIWNAMKALIKGTPHFQNVIDRAVEGSKKLLRKQPPLRKFVSEAVEISQSKMKIPLSLIPDLKMVLEFRNNHAKIIDEPPNEVLTFEEAVILLNARPVTNENEIEKLLVKKRKYLPESSQSWTKTLLRLLNEGPKLWERMKTEKNCHVCRGRNEYPHIAWGCVEGYSASNVARYMNEPQNIDFRRKEYNRRLRNWQEKHGDKPCPYLKKSQ